MLYAGVILQKFGYTALAWAVHFDFPAAASVLLNLGANLQIITKVTG